MTIRADEFTELATLIFGHGEQNINPTDGHEFFSLDGIHLFGRYPDKGDLAHKNMYMTESVRVAFEDGTMLLVNPQGHIAPITQIGENQLQVSHFETKKEERQATETIRGIARELEIEYRNKKRIR